MKTARKKRLSVIVPEIGYFDMKTARKKRLSVIDPEIVLL